MFKISAFPRKSLKWLLQRKKTIDFNPDFQRGSRVWKEPEQAFLIDSILNDFEIPRIYLLDYTTHDIRAINPRKKRYAVIDGKQRLLAMLQFLQNDVRLSKRFVMESNPGLDLGGMKYKDLKARVPAIARIVEDYEPDIRRVESDEREKVNDFFLRLNKAAKALNGAEMRNAMIGIAVEGIRGLATHSFFRRKISFDTTRSQDKNTAAKILMVEFESGPAETKKKNLDNFVRQVNIQGPGRFGRALKRARSNLTLLGSQFGDNDPLLSTQGHIALYYLFISRLGSAERKRARKFIEDFERQRVKNRNRADGRVDPELSKYDLAARTTNDKNSIVVRLDVLRKRFRIWKRRKPNVNVVTS